MRYTPRQYAAALVDSVIGKSQSQQEEVYARFMEVLAKSGGRSQLPKILRQYQKLRRERMGISAVELTTATTAPHSLLKEIAKAFNGKVEIRETVDKSVLGGVKMVIDDEFLIDATFKGRAKRLLKELLFTNV